MLPSDNNISDNDTYVNLNDDIEVRMNKIATNKNKHKNFEDPFEKNINIDDPSSNMINPPTKKQKIEPRLEVVGKKSAAQYSLEIVKSEQNDSNIPMNINGNDLTNSMKAPVINQPNEKSFLENTAEVLYNLEHQLVTSEDRLATEASIADMVANLTDDEKIQRNTDENEYQVREIQHDFERRINNQGQNIYKSAYDQYLDDIMANADMPSQYWDRERDNMKKLYPKSEYERDLEEQFGNNNFIDMNENKSILIPKELKLAEINTPSIISYDTIQSTILKQQDDENKSGTAEVSAQGGVSSYFGSFINIVKSAPSSMYKMLTLPKMQPIEPPIKNDEINHIQEPFNNTYNTQENKNDEFISQIKPNTNKRNIKSNKKNKLNINKEIPSHSDKYNGNIFVSQLQQDIQKIKPISSQSQSSIKIHNVDDEADNIERERDRSTRGRPAPHSPVKSFEEMAQSFPTYIEPIKINNPKIKEKKIKESPKFLTSEEMEAIQQKIVPEIIQSQLSKQISYGSIGIQPTSTIPLPITENIPHDALHKFTPEVTTKIVQLFQEPENISTDNDIQILDRDKIDSNININPTQSNTASLQKVSDMYKNEDDDIVIKEHRNLVQKNEQQQQENILNYNNVLPSIAQDVEENFNEDIDVQEKTLNKFIEPVHFQNFVYEFQPFNNNDFDDIIKDNDKIKQQIETNFNIDNNNAMDRNDDVIEDDDDVINEKQIEEDIIQTKRKTQHESSHQENTNKIVNIIKGFDFDKYNKDFENNEKVTNEINENLQSIIFPSHVGTYPSPLFLNEMDFNMMSNNTHPYSSPLDIEPERKLDIDKTQYIKDRTKLKDELDIFNNKINELDDAKFTNQEHEQKILDLIKIADYTTYNDFTKKKFNNIQDALTQVRKHYNEGLFIPLSEEDSKTFKTLIPAPFSIQRDKEAEIAFIKNGINNFKYANNYKDIFSFVNDNSLTQLEKHKALDNISDLYHYKKSKDNEYMPDPNGLTYPPTSLESLSSVKPLQQTIYNDLPSVPNNLGNIINTATSVNINPFMSKNVLNPIIKPNIVEYPLKFYKNMPAIDRKQFYQNDMKIDNNLQVATISRQQPPPLPPPTNFTNNNDPSKFVSKLRTEKDEDEDKNIYHNNTPFDEDNDVNDKKFVRNNNNNNQWFHEREIQVNWNQFQSMIMEPQQIPYQVKHYRPYTQNIQLYPPIQPHQQMHDINMVDLANQIQPNNHQRQHRNDIEMKENNNQPIRQQQQQLQQQQIIVPPKAQQPKKVNVQPPAPVIPLNPDVKKSMLDLLHSHGKSLHNWIEYYPETDEEVAELKLKAEAGKLYKKRESDDTYQPCTSKAVHKFKWYAEYAGIAGGAIPVDVPTKGKLRTLANLVETRPHGNPLSQKSFSSYYADKTEYFPTHKSHLPQLRQLANDGKLYEVEKHGRKRKITNDKDVSLHKYYVHHKHGIHAFAGGFARNAILNDNIHEIQFHALHNDKIRNNINENMPHYHTKNIIDSTMKNIIHPLQQVSFSDEHNNKMNETKEKIKQILLHKVHHKLIQY